MKKIYLLLAVALLTFSASAQNVILRLDNSYDVSIDGRNYEGNATIPNLGYGQHTINVYEVKKGFLGIGKKRNLVSTSNFELRNNDVTIDVDQNGQLRINELGNYNTQNRRYDRTTDRNYDRNTDRDYDRNDGKNGKGYGPYNNPGKGNKYGLYKDKSSKVDKSQNANKGKGKK
jgi:hypothetical protein